MVLYSSAVNGVAIIVGALIGVLLKKGLPERISGGVMQGMALCVMAIGIKGIFDSENFLIPIISIAVGGALGHWIDLDKYLNRFGDFMQKKLTKGESGSTFGEGFVTATLLVCVGAMAITGALDSGIRGDHSTIFAKSLIDFVSCMIMASTLGIGVAFAGVACFAYQGIIALGGSAIAVFLTDAMIGEMSCVGSLLIIAIALNMLGLTKIKVVNFIPACFLPLALCPVL
ncbi:MAG: DUF554 domain-containing protein [Clostridia bacterium]|nr:DUF554 domain-containing protein [Clostridia bacterium]